MTESSPTDAADREVVLTRVLHATPAQVWAAWTDPARLAAWWGPEGFTTTTHAMDLRPGGVWRHTMHGPDGRGRLNHFVFDEVVPPERLVYRHDGGAEGVEPVTFSTAVSLDDLGGATRLTLRQTFASTEQRERVERDYGAFEGGMQCLARLAAEVARATGGRRESLTVGRPRAGVAVFRRVFDAPVERVFEAHSKAEHVRRWWGPRDHETLACEIDFRPGGSWRIVQRTPDGAEHPFRGEYLEIDPPRRFVHTFVYDVEGVREHVATEAFTFEADGERTVLTSVMTGGLCMDSDGMDAGATETMDRLAEFVEAVAVAAVEGGRS